MTKFSPYRWVLVGLALNIGAMSWAADAMVAWTPPVAGEVYFDATAIDVAKILPPPPAPDSLTAESDLQAVLQAQAWRTPAQVDWAERVAAADFFALFAEDLLPPEFTKANCPEIVRLFRGVYSTSAPVSEASKKMYARPRPFLADARVQACVERLPSGSYPSGHGQAARIWAAILSELYPEKKAELEARADRIAWGRVLGGVHYPTDLAAGERLGDALLAEMRKSPTFRAQLERCRNEIAALAHKKAA